MERRMRLTSFGIVALQLVFILGLVAYKEVTLRFGTEVMLQTVPVDPRDLFRGDYVTLRYGISTLERSRIWFPYDVAQGYRVYVHIVPSTPLQDGEAWSARRLDTEVNDGWDIFLKCTVTNTSSNSMSVEYGLEAYFVPRGQGLEIEHANDVKVRVAVDRFGTGVVKGLIVDGESWEPR